MFRRLRGSAPSASAQCMLPCSESRAACRDIVARWIGLSDSAQALIFEPGEQSSAGIGFPRECTDVRKRGTVKSQSRAGVNFEDAGRGTVGEIQPACQCDPTKGQIDHPMESRGHDRPRYKSRGGCGTTKIGVRWPIAAARIVRKRGVQTDGHAGMARDLGDEPPDRLIRGFFDRTNLSELVRRAFERDKDRVFEVRGPRKVDADDEVRCFSHRPGSHGQSVSRDETQVQAKARPNANEADRPEISLRSIRGDRRFSKCRSNLRIRT